MTQALCFRRGLYVVVASLPAWFLSCLFVSAAALLTNQLVHLLSPGRNKEERRSSTAHPIPPLLLIHHGTIPSSRRTTLPQPLLDDLMTHALPDARRLALDALAAAVSKDLDHAEVGSALVTGQCSGSCSPRPT